MYVPCSPLARALQSGSDDKFTAADAMHSHEPMPSETDTFTPRPRCIHTYRGGHNVTLIDAFGHRDGSHRQIDQSHICAIRKCEHMSAGVNASSGILLLRHTRVRLLARPNDSMRLLAKRSLARRKEWALWASMPQTFWPPPARASSPRGQTQRKGPHEAHNQQAQRTGPYCRISADEMRHLRPRQPLRRMLSHRPALSADAASFCRGLVVMSFAVGSFGGPHPCGGGRARLIVVRPSIRSLGFLPAGRQRQSGRAFRCRARPNPLRRLGRCVEVVHPAIRCLGLLPAGR
mmetsp:Transcript_29118/g.68127  ORF Transcript_29118/g.68127 Transcript_29118/m.68127 type:complete len:290 (-) Transcript_29118:873-1742(-)